MLGFAPLATSALASSSDTSVAPITGTAAITLGGLTVSASATNGEVQAGASLVLVGFERERSLVSDGVTRTLTGFARERSF